MYRSFTIKNFRGFDTFEVTSLERINLIAGKNNVGKTSLLEALTLHAGWNNLDVPQGVDHLRHLKPDERSAEGMWAWLFRDKRTDKPIELIEETHEGLRDDVQIEFESPPQFVKSRSTIGAIQGVSQSLRVKHKSTRGDEHQSRASVTSEGLRYEPVPDLDLPRGAFLPSNFSVAVSDLEAFSRLKAEGRDKAIVEDLKRIEPRLRDLSILIQGGAPVICGDIGAGILMPLQLLGQGMVKLLGFLSVINTASIRYVMVDEIENGLHYSVLTDIWKVIAHAARNADCQVFASTHSWECIRAAHEAFSSERPYDFRLHRLDRTTAGVRSVTYDQEALEGALAAGLEVR